MDPSHQVSNLLITIATIIASLSMLCFTNVADAAQGKAVFHNALTPSACYQYQNRGDMITGVSDKLWDNGNACGRRYRVRCIGAANLAPRSCRTTSGAVIVTVVDLCRNCDGDINLSRAAFNRIADVDAGIVRVQYDAI
ncbi:unnamed protein product [Linum tenue]|uniref:Expansin-like EG45 domain-containing protein n=1 Tax=Linum tenue TaxID=586396 RepID=A0AAV0KZT7_9ROSI|nr:unnamed protein product [Linum tenue]